MLIFSGMIHILVTSNDAMEIFISRQEIFLFSVVHEVAGVISTVVAEFQSEWGLLAVNVNCNKVLGGMCGIYFYCTKIFHEIQPYESGLVIMSVIKIYEDIW